VSKFSRRPLRCRGEPARVQNVFLEDRVRSVDFDQRYVVAPKIGEVLKHALGVGLVQLGALDDGMAQHQSTIAGKINVDYLDVGVDEPEGDVKGVSGASPTSMMAACNSIPGDSAGPIFCVIPT